MSSRRDRKERSPDLGILAGQLLFAVQDELFATLAEQGHPGLRPQHGAVLGYVDEGGTRATDLAIASGQHKQVVGKLVDELELLGYVERHPDPTDRRAKLIVPTAKGKDQMMKSDAIMAAIGDRHAARMGPAAYGQFVEFLHELTRRQRSWQEHHTA